MLLVHLDSSLECIMILCIGNVRWEMECVCVPVKAED